MGLILIGAKSKPREISGQTVAFEALIKEMTNENKIIDINCYSKTPIKKVFFYVKLFLVLFKYLITKKTQKVYLTISQSKTGFFRDFVFIWITFFFRKPIVLHLHGGNYKEFYNRQSYFFRRIIKSTLSRAQIIIVLSETFKSMFSFINKYESKMQVVFNGIEPPKANPAKDLSGTIRLLYLSNLIESKGYLDVLHASKFLKEKYNKNFQIEFCGKFMSSEDDTIFKDVVAAEEYFYNYIIDNDLSTIVKYRGIVQGLQKEEMLNHSHFILLPSFYISEGQPISIIEGLAYGCVPICTDYRDLKNIVKDNWNGLIVKKNDPEGIADKILNLTSDHFVKLSNNAKMHFLGNYTLENHIRAMKNIFNE